MKKLLSCLFTCFFAVALLAACNQQAKTEGNEQTSTVSNGKIDIPSATMERLLSIFKELGKDKVDAQSKVNELGLDEIEMGELATSIENEFNVKITSSEIKNFATIGDVATHIVKNMPK